MKTKTLKQILATTVLTSTLLLTTAGISNAGFQANQNTQYKKSAEPEEWISYIRQMEQAGGAMGLSETQKTDLTSEGSNGIDVHMMRTTEFGAIAILSASGYGNPSNMVGIATTTGNSTGMILNTKKSWEVTAGGLRDFAFSGINARYYDAYDKDRTLTKIGDALGKPSTTNPGCAGWHSADTYDWVSESNCYFVRGRDSIFEFGYTSASGNVFCRGVAVVGTGF